MRWTTLGTSITVGLFMLAANIPPAHAQSGDARGAGHAAGRPAYQEHDAVTDASFSSTADREGNAHFTVRVGDFLLEKALAPTGEATIRLTEGKDVVSIVMNHGGYVVSRGGRTVRLSIQSTGQDDLDAVRSLLLGSQAVRTFRRLSASMENRDDNDNEGPLFLSALVDGAIVQRLDGDTGAPARIGKRITRKHRAGLRPAMFRPDNLFTDCILNYEMSLVEAWDLYGLCMDTALNSAWYVYPFAEDLCELEFLIRSQQYIYQFVSCLAIP
jgi:hypothetical protein